MGLFIESCGGVTGETDIPICIDTDSACIIGSGGAQLLGPGFVTVSIILDQEQVQFSEMCIAVQRSPCITRDDLILIKYNSSGTRQWTQQFGSSGSDYARGISLDSSGNIYVVGDTSGGLGSNSNSGSEDLFLIKYNSSGNLQWTQQMGTFSNDVAFDVATDSLGNSYVTGYTGASLDGNTYSGELDLFLVKYDSNGNKSWTKQLGTSTSDYARGVSVDADGNVSFTGYTTAALDGQTHYGSDDLFLVKYNSSGTKLWTRQLGTSSLDRAVDVIHDASGNAYIAGSTLGDLDYHRSTGGDDLFLVKYNSDGVKQ